MFKNINSAYANDFIEEVQQLSTDDLFNIRVTKLYNEFHNTNYTVAQMEIYNKLRKLTGDK